MSASDSSKQEDQSLLATLSESNLHHTSGNDGSGERGTEKVDVLIDGVTLNSGWSLGMTL